MKALYIAAVVGSASLLVACTAKVDGSDQESFEKSVNKMVKDMSPQEQRTFGRDLADASSLKNMNLAAVFDPQVRANLQTTLRKELDGKSVEDIHAMAITARTAARDAQIQNVQATIDAKEADLARDEADSAEVRKVAIENLKVTAVQIPNPGDKGATTIYQTAMSYTVKNNSSKTISGVTVVPKTDDPNAPEKEFFYTHFDQPLLPGQQAEVKLDELKGGWVHYNPGTYAFTSSEDGFSADIHDERGDHGELGYVYSKKAKLDDIEIYRKELERVKALPVS